MRKISLIIPCYNVSGDKSERMMESIFSQDYDNVEVILVDDGSVDDTYECLKKWARRFIQDRGYSAKVFTKENGGPASAINVGLKNFTGDYICFPDADDQLLPGYLSEMAHFLDTHTEFGWVRCDAQKTDEFLNLYTSSVNHFEIEYGTLFEKYLTGGANYVVWLIMVRREYLIKAIPDLTLYENRGTQEWQIVLPLSFYGDSGYLDKPLYKYIVYDNSFYHHHKKDTEKYKKYLHCLYQAKIYTLLKLPIGKDYFSKLQDLIEIGELSQSIWSGLYSELYLDAKLHFFQKKYGLDFESKDKSEGILFIRKAIIST